MHSKLECLACKYSMILHFTPTHPSIHKPPPTQRQQTTHTQVHRKIENRKEYTSLLNIHLSSITKGSKKDIYINSWTKAILRSWQTTIASTEQGMGNKAHRCMEHLDKVYYHQMYHTLTLLTTNATTNFRYQQTQDHWCCKLSGKYSQQRPNRFQIDWDNYTEL